MNRGGCPTPLQSHYNQVMDDDERQKKIDFGRAKTLPNMPKSQSLASFRQKRAKGDGARAPKKAEKRKGQNVSQNDSSTQDCCVDTAPHSQLDLTSNQDTERTAIEEIKRREDPSSTQNQSSSFVKDLSDEELAALTDKEQLKQLQQAVEKRNEIIAKLSTNLQEALLSRDRVQLEALSLAGQIQALQRQLQQTSEGFLRLKNQTSAEVSNSPQQQPSNLNLNDYQTINHQYKSHDGSSCSRTESLSSEANETEMDNVLHKLRAELEEERKNSQCIFAKLAEEIEKNQHVLSVLEREKQEREEEHKEKDKRMQSLLTQLSQVESQCLLMQQYKDEKEKLNGEVLELRKRLQEENDAETRLNEEVASATLYLQEVKQKKEQEMERLKEKHTEEIERVQQLLHETLNQLRSREEEVKGLTASRNQEKAFCSSNKTIGGKDSFFESGYDQVLTNASKPGDTLMERYFSSVPVAKCQSSVVNESLEECSELAISAEPSFELNSELFGDQPLLSISNRTNEDDKNIHYLSNSQNLDEDSPLGSQWPHNSSYKEMDQSEMSQQKFEVTDLGKELLYQECEELREELCEKDRDLKVLKEEVSKTAEELEEARSRWAQVTEELQQAFVELEEEKAKRKNEEELSLIDLEKKHIQKNKSGALLENEKYGTIIAKPEEKTEASLKDENLLKTLQNQCKHLMSELEEMKMEHQSTSNLLNQRTEELATIVKDLEKTRTEIVTVQTEVDTLRTEVRRRQDSLECAEKENKELENQILRLKQNLASLEDASAQLVKEREEHRRKKEEMDERVKRIEQVLEEELEQFENMLRTKDTEFAEAREKWEEEQQEKDNKVLGVTQLLEKQLKEKENMINALMEKQLLAVEEAGEKLRRLHLQEMEEMKEKHQQEISALDGHLKDELLRQHVSMEEEQKQQISFIKQVNEREHEWMMSELNAKHEEELSRLKTEVILELREHMEAAHQAELQQAQAQKLLELEALRLHLTTVHGSQQEQESSLKAQDSMLKNQHLAELEEIKIQYQEQQERLKVFHQQDIAELKQQWETCVANQDKETQTLKAQYDADAETSKANFQISLADLKNQLTITQTELTSTQASLSETRNSLNKAHTALSQTQCDLQEAQELLDGLQSSSKKQAENLQEELNQAIADRDAALCSLDQLVSTHKTVLQETEQKVLHLEEKERHLQQEVLRLQEEKTLLQQGSEKEVGQLWAQLESMRTSRQELGELKEQLMERSSRVNDIERLKAEFNEQKQEIKEQNEAELESLRRYFEKRLHATEENYREEIALLQLRLVEGALEDSLLITTADSSLCHVQSEEKNDHSDSKQENGKVHLDLTDHYYDELQELKTQHALDLEQLGAKLSDGHLRELTRLRLDAAQQVEAEVEQRIWSSNEELWAATSAIHTLETRLAAINKQHNAEVNKRTQKLKQEFSAELINLEKALKQEKERMQQDSKRLEEEVCVKYKIEISTLRSEHEKEVEERKLLEKALCEEREKFETLQVALDNDEKLKELTAVFSEQSKESLRRAQERFQQEKAAMEQHLSEKHENSLEELKVKLNAELEHQRAALLTKHCEELSTLNAKHNAQLEALGASHRDQLAAMTVKLESKHNAELVALDAALNSKRERDIETLEGVFQKTNRVELETLEAELLQRYQNEKDELEQRMLGNMDTLETTYLKEVQALRDEMVVLEERHSQTLNCKSQEHKQQIERHAAAHLAAKEDLRKELAHAHMDKFRAMAAELSLVHKTELAAQKENLDAENCKLLEILKKQVLDLEQQHSTAQQELSLAYTSENEQLTERHQLQLQELKGISARELERCRRDLEEESSNQRQHFLKELELLNVQSEERLQGGVNQLKTDFEKKKKVELEELRRSFSIEQEEKEKSYTGKMSQLTAQLQQLDAVVAQLRAEVGCLQGELEGKRAEMETLDTLLQRRERETQEGGNLLKMLTDDLQAAKEERHRLHHGNEMLKQVLLEMLRSILATEELIGNKINTKNSKPATHLSSAETKNTLESETSSDDLELTHQLCESLLVSGNQINPGGEEAALSACSRLHQTVDTLLELLNQANCQLEQTHNVHLSLEEKFSQRREDSAQLLEQHNLLLEQLDHEAKQKSHLQLELHKAEGLLEGYMAEKSVLEESLQQKEIQEEKLVEELELLKVKLHQRQGLRVELDALIGKHQELSEEHAILLRQKEHLSAGLGEKEKALLAETERLSQDRLDLQRQAEKDHKSLSMRLRTLERELEEQVTKGQETEQYHKTNTEDLLQQVQALEKQLKNNRQFIEEQAVEREHERDEFQQEICRLEAQLKQTASVDNKGHKYEDLVLQVESLQAVIKDKSDDHASLSAANQQVQRDLAERNEEIDKLAGRIRELEQALLNSAESSRSVSQLDAELHRTKLKEQELTRDKQALEQQQLSSRLQISALQSKLDETRHCYHDDARNTTLELRDALDTAQQSLQCKEHEADVLVGQLENVQRDLSIKEVEVKHLTLQLELLTTNNAAHVNELQEQIAALTDNLSALTILQEEKDKEVSAEELENETLPSALLQEKNQEIDHLNREIQRLEQELENVKDNKALEAEIEDLRSQVEHLQSEVTRVRNDKREEEERFIEVIGTLQGELSTLGSNAHEVSDSQDGDSIDRSPAASPEPQGLEQERRGAPGSLKQELGLTHSAPSCSLRSHLKALQTRFDTAIAEKEGLERLLFTQEEEYRGHGEVFGEMLKAEREKAEELQGFLILKEAELKGVQAELEEERDRIKVTMEEWERLKVETEEGRTLVEDKAQLKSLVLELQKHEQDKVVEINTLKAQQQEIEKEREVLKETSLTLEKRVQEVQAEVLDMEKLLTEERGKIQNLTTVKQELSAEREALRRREGQLQEEIEKFRLEGISLRSLIQKLTGKLNEKESCQEEAQKEALTHAELTLAKADTALKQKELEIASLRTEHQALRTELTSVQHGLSASTERAEKLHQEGQTKDRALLDLENDNQRLKVELESLQEDIAVQEEELAHQQRDLQRLRQRWDHWDRTPERYTQKSPSDHRTFEDVVTPSQKEVSLSSPEVLRKMETSDRIPERLHASVLVSRLSEFSGLNSTGLDSPQNKPSPQGLMELPYSRTITPDSASQKSHSTCAGTMSDTFSVLHSLDAEKVQDSEGIDLTTPSSILGSTSSMSAAEWASDGYGSNVSSELGARLKVELEQTERLDAQFVEYLRCRGMNPTINTDSAAGSMSYSDDLLSPELQGLLKKVFQESCRILSLSQQRTAPSTQAHVSDLKAVSNSGVLTNDCSASLDDLEEASTLPPMSWQQEKRALQETVIALRELLCRIAQRRTPENLTSECTTEERVESHFRTELQENQQQLRSARDALQEQGNKLSSLRLTVEECEEALRREQTKVQELHQELEQERALTLRKDKEYEERRESEHASSEKQKSDVRSLMGQMEQERVVCSNLRQELQIEQSRSVLLEKRLADTHKELEEERQRFGYQQELSLQDKTRLERLLTEAESRLADVHSKLSDSHRSLDEEREHWSRQVDELSHRHEVDATRDTKFIADLRSQLEHEQRQGEELAMVTDQLRAQLLQSRRKWEEEDHIRRMELQREQEATIRNRVAMGTLKEKNREVGHSLELERELTKHKGLELEELKNKLRLMKEKEREREEEWERERKRGRQEQKERERRQERTKNKLRELEFLRQEDQQRMQQLQRTLAELERDEREMAVQRLTARTTGQQKKTSSTHHNNFQSDSTQESNAHQQQTLSSSQSKLLENFVKDNSALSEHVTSLSQERNNLKLKLAQLERRLQNTECNLAQVTTGTDSRLVNDVTSNCKLQRVYERYLRAESFRKALVYQKRYLLLLLGGFQEGEKVTLRFIAHLGALPSPHPSSQRRPIGRFRAVVRVVVAVSRMKFLTRKWQKAIRRLSPGIVNGHGSKPEVLRQQLSSYAESLDSRHTVNALVPPSKSPFRLHNSSSTGLPVVNLGGMSQDAEQTQTEQILHLEKVQQRLVVTTPVSETHLAPPPNEERRIQSACSPDMIGYRQRWLQENGTWLYLSCLSPLYLNGPGSPAFHPDPK